MSVVLPTFNDSVRLAQALQAIFRLEPPPGGLEVVVVDDGSTDQTAARLPQLAADCPWPLLALRLRRNRGRSLARNVGVQYAAGEIIAFTDSDCLPDAGWLAAAAPHFAAPEVGLAQGQTLPVPNVPPPLFSHFMEVTRPDGHFATCNILYRREDLLAAGGFNPALAPNGSPLGTWEDVDLGWRVLGQGRRPVFEPEAKVYHQIVPLNFWDWLTWPLRLGRRPQIAARYPVYRRFLYRRLWIDRGHAWLTLAALGPVLAPLTHPLALLAGLPYLIHVLRRHGFTGRWPALKFILHIIQDVIGFAALLARSVQFARLVL